MKKVIQILLVLVPLLATQGSYASEQKRLKSMEQVLIQKVTKKTNAAGIETYSGKKISLGMVKKKFFKKKTISEVMSRAQIELKSGDILYPEEVEFALVSTARHPHQRSPDDEERRNERAPHTDEGAD